MKILELIKETEKTYKISYRGEILTIDKDCHELLIGRKMYKLSALRKRWCPVVPSSEIKALEKIEVHTPKILTSFSETLVLTSAKKQVEKILNAAPFIEAVKPLQIAAPFDKEPKFVCFAKEIYKAVKEVSKVINRSNALLILDNLLLTLEKNSLTIAASNLNKYFSKTIEVESRHRGKMLVSAKVLRELLATFPDMPLTFQLKENASIGTAPYQFVISSDTGIYKIGCFDDVEDFPEPHADKEPEEYDNWRTPLPKLSEDEILARYEKDFARVPDAEKPAVIEKVKDESKKNKAEIRKIYRNGLTSKRDLVRIKELEKVIRVQKQFVERSKSL